MDRFLLTTKGGQQLFIDPRDATSESVGPDLSYPADDPNGPGEASIVAEEFVNLEFFIQGGPRDFSMVLSVDSERDTLDYHTFRTGDGQGVVKTSQPLGRDVTDDVSLSTTRGIPNQIFSYIALTDVGATTSTLYLYFPLAIPREEPLVLARIGTIGGGAVIRDFSIVPIPSVTAVGVPSFAAADYGASSDSTSATLIVTRTGGTAEATFPITTLPALGTAVLGRDYLSPPEVVTFAFGQTTAEISVPIIPNSFAEGTRTLVLQVGGGDSGVEPSQATLTIFIPSVTPTPTPPPPPLTPGVASVAFAGSANVVTGVDVRFASAADAGLAGSAANFVVQGVTSGRKVAVARIAVASASYDAATGTTHVTFAAPIALATYRSLFVTAVGLASGGTSGTVVSRVIRGSTVRYQDADGDLVTLRATGQLARVVVVVPFGGGSASAYVAGRVRVVTGSLRPRRGSNRMATIDRFATGGARLKLARSIVVAQISTA